MTSVPKIRARTAVRPLLLGSPQTDFRDKDCARPQLRFASFQTRPVWHCAVNINIDASELEQGFAACHYVYNLSKGLAIGVFRASATSLDILAEVQHMKQQRLRGRVPAQAKTSCNSLADGVHSPTSHEVYLHKQDLKEGKESLSEGAMVLLAHWSRGWGWGVGFSLGFRASGRGGGLESELQGLMVVFSMGVRSFLMVFDGVSGFA